MNIVIPFRNTCGTNELQMCIKLINKNMTDYFSLIYVVGDEIDFVDSSVINIKVKEQKYNKWLDSSFLVDYYIKNISNESFFLFNDDFFITSPLKADDFKYYNFGTLLDRIETTYVIDNKTGILRLSAYGLNIKKFVSTYGNYKNYEVHIPMPILFPDIMSQAIAETKENDCPALKRTYYMKLLEDKGLSSECSIETIPYDIKFGEPLRVMQYPFFSLTDVEYRAFEKTFEEILAK